MAGILPGGSGQGCLLLFSKVPDCPEFNKLRCQLADLAVLPATLVPLLLRCSAGSRPSLMTALLPKLPRSQTLSCPACLSPPLGQLAGSHCRVPPPAPTCLSGRRGQAGTCLRPVSPKQLALPPHCSSQARHPCLGLPIAFTASRPGRPFCGGLSLSYL